MNHLQFVTIVALTVLTCAPASAAGPQSTTKLSTWERGLAVQSPQQADMLVYLWFYEWNMFEAMTPGQHTRGTHMLKRTVNDAGTVGSIDSPALKLKMTAKADGAELLLTVANTTDYDWPRIAAIIPCFNPGPEQIRNRQFANTNTYYLRDGGLEKLNNREIHFNAAVRKQVDSEANDGKYVWTSKWPLSETNAVGGLIVRESTDGKWVCGIAWDDFLSAQGHNPWECMHLSVRVGPLERGASKTVRGRIYLFPGSRQDCLEKYLQDFGAPAKNDE